MYYTTNSRLFIKSIFLLASFFLFLSNANAQTFSWAKQFNYGSTTFYNKVSAVDADGNYYTSGKDFIVKLNSSGTVIWVRQFTGFSSASTSNYISGIAVDASGNVFVGGSFASTYNFNRSGGTFNLTPSAHVDGFIEKMDASGNFLWAEEIGGPGNDNINSVCVDISGNIYLTGKFGYFGTTSPGTYADFDPGADQYLLTSSGRYDYFVEKLDAAGNFIWAKSAGGTLDDAGGQIATDVSGNLFVWGSFSGTVSFDASATLTGSNGRFLEKFDASGNFLWVKQLQGNGCCLDITDVAIDASGNLLSTGYFSGTVDFDPGSGTYNLTGPDLQDLFIWKLDNAGNFVWAKKVDGGGGTNRSCHGDGIAVDTYGNIYTTGDFTGKATFDFDPGAGTFNMKSNNVSMYVLKLNSSGNFVWAFQAAGNNSSTAQGYGIQASASGALYTSANISGTVNFNPNGTYNLSSANGPFVVQKVTQVNNGMKANFSQAAEPSISVAVVYPNPNSGSFFVEVPAVKSPVELIITDLSGRELMKKSIDGYIQQRVQIDLADKSKGIYLVQVKSINYNWQSKIVYQ